MYLGIDYGKKRIGLAVGKIFPRGIGIIENKGGQEKNTEKIAQICQENEIKKIILGLPERSSGKEGDLAPEVRNFGQKLKEKIELPVIFESEQFTSCEAEQFLKNHTKKYDNKSGKVDELAAIIILEQYIHSTNVDKQYE